MNDPSKINQSINIVYAANDGYAMLAGISIISLFENNRDVNDINVYILSDNIKDDNKDKLNEISRKYNRNITVIDISEELEKLIDTGLSGYVNSLDNGHTIYARFVIGMLFPELTRMLYLDCDTLINGNISELYHRDLCGNPIGLAYDCSHDNYKKYIDLPHDAHYFNSGVMLTDLDKWRENRCYERIIEHIKKVNASYPLPDQDLLNKVLGTECTPLHMSDNYLSQYLLYDYKSNLFVYNKKSGVYWTDKEWISPENAPKQAIIFHFSGKTFTRPWFSNSKHPFKKLYDVYYEISPWHDIPMSSTDMPFEYRMQYISYRYFPKWLNRLNGYIMQRAFMKIRYDV